jgi:sigma-B regulation protein RsbU (phosphoserine phosphatase)
MASGLVLAAVRGGLHLLRRNLERPVEVLDRLDGMLRATAPGRMFVTLQIVLIDRRRREIVVANAGHPPLIRLTAEGSETVGTPGRPLGTNLGGEFGRQSVSFEPGDALILYTDGVTELSNLHGDPFGPERLERDAARKRTEASAKALRDELLASLTHFRADAVQEDDMTLVVVGLEPGLGG